MDTARASHVDFLFEAAVAGGIPIIRPLKQCLAGNHMSEVMGIVNGTTNFILTKMSQENMEFKDALALATELGYAEADPTADIDGLDAGRKVAILGDMFELGENERAMHREVGQYAAEKGIDLILCVGGLSSEMYEGAAEKGGEARHFEIREALEAVLQDLLQPGDTVLVKASHSMAFENIVQNIQENE